MAPFFGLMKRAPSSTSSMYNTAASSASSQRSAPAVKKMPALMPPPTARSSTSDVASSVRSGHSEDDYGSFLSDVVVVGAGPSGLMLAYVLKQ